MISLYDKLLYGRLLGTKGARQRDEDTVDRDVEELALSLALFLFLLIHLMGEVRGQIFQLTQSDRSQMHTQRYRYTAIDTDRATTLVNNINKHSRRLDRTETAAT